VLPGKTYTVHDIGAVLWRGRWKIVLPFVTCLAAAIGIGWRLPDQFRSETLVLVIPQRVPETYVRSTVTSKIEDRVLYIREQILSRSRLERIISEFDLYPELRAKMPMEEIVDEMRSKVVTRVVRGDAFSVSFVAGSPVMAQRVTERLASLFSEENMRDREVLAQNTNQFLQTQLDEARQQLTEREKRLEEYRRKYAGELPDQVPINLQAIQNGELQSQALTESLNRDRERRMFLERQIAEVENGDAIAVATPATASAPNATPTLEQQLEAAEAGLREMQSRLTAQHPDVITAGLKVQRLRRQVESQQRGTTDTRETSRNATETARQNRMNQLRDELETLNRQIAQKQTDEERLRGTINGYRAKVNAAPTRESELVALNRDYETLQRQYRNLLEKFEDSKVAANLERRQIGEQFRILDPARVPERPFTPNRRLIAGAGAGFGLVLGIALVGWIEFSDRSFRRRADVEHVTSLPVLAAIPSITTPDTGRWWWRGRRAA